MKTDRTATIISLLVQKQKMDVAELADLCHVSQVTMRKDLDALEERGLVKRVHGYAEISSTDDINGRLAYHYEEKTGIARKAAELVHDGDTVMIESGSCCALLASVLSETRKNITIITNSAFIADYVRKSDVNIVLLGGIYQKDSQCLVGPSILQQIRNFHVRYFFAGTDGYSKTTGFTNRDQLRAQAVRDMSQSCDEFVILTESEKFLQAGTVPMNIAKPTIVITDENLEDSVRKELEGENIQIRESM